MLSPVHALAFFLVTMASIELGRLLRIRFGAEKHEVGALEGAVFGLMGLLLAFSFSGAASRYDQRRDLIVTECNSIGTAYLRLDIVPEPLRETLQRQFAGYLDTRLRYYENLNDNAASENFWQQSCQQQSQIWGNIAGFAREHRDPVTATLIVATNEMFDIASSRRAALSAHPPLAIYLLLVSVCLLCSVLAGFTMGTGRSLTHSLCFAATLAVTLFVIADLEYPRHGWIRVSEFDRFLREVRQTMPQIKA